MRFDWRTSAIAAGAAFLLSFLAGVLAGVSFGALLLRALIGAVVFGAGAIGISVIIDRYLPDLKQGVSAESSGSEEQLGSRVDIVVDDEAAGGQPLTGERGTSEFELEEAEGEQADFGSSRGEAAPGFAGEAAPAPEAADAAPAASAAPAAPAEEAAPAAPAASAASGGEEPGLASQAPGQDIEAGEEASAFTPGLSAERVHVESGDGSVAGDADTAGSAEGAGSADSTRGADDIEELEELETEEAGGPEGASQEQESASERPADSTPEVASAGSLPDIEGFAGSFADAPAEAQETEDDSAASGEDPSVMARAIRTVLKREE